MSISIWSHKYLFYLAFYTLLLIIWCVFIFSQENLKRTCLICYSVHAINLQIHSTIKCSSSDHILKFEFASRIRIFFFAYTLVDFRNLQSLTPNFTHQPIEFLLRRIFRVGVVRILNVLVEIKLPMLIFILNSPLNNTHIAYRCTDYCSILKYFNRLNHTCMTAETSCSSHVSFLHEIKFEICYF